MEGFASIVLAATAAHIPCILSIYLLKQRLLLLLKSQTDSYQITNIRKASVQAEYLRRDEQLAGGTHRIGDPKPGLREQHGPLSLPWSDPPG